MERESKMDITAILKELYQERELLDQAIVTLERAQASTYRRRGRPPKWLERARSEKPDSRAMTGTVRDGAGQRVSKRKTRHAVAESAANTVAKNGGAKNAGGRLVGEKHIREKQPGGQRTDFVGQTI